MPARCVLQILDAMNQDSGVPLTQLQVDGGMTANRLLMQLQADILCIPVGKKTAETHNKNTNTDVFGILQSQRMSIIEFNSSFLYYHKCMLEYCGLFHIENTDLKSINIYL